MGKGERGKCGLIFLRRKERVKGGSSPSMKENGEKGGTPSQRSFFSLGGKKGVPSYDE